MISKIDPPKAFGNYNNKGKVDKLANYLTSEKEQKMEKGELFFNFERDNITREEVKEMINNNVKGLKREDAKFISISINPSDDELKHIGNDKTKLKEFIKQAAKNYANNFPEKRGINENDLVWVAVVHKYRYYTEREMLNKAKNKIPANKRVGDAKIGNNMHAHVIISMRDKAMKKTLSPYGTKKSFNIINWQTSNERSFDHLFNYPRKIAGYTKYQKEQIGKLVEGIHKMDMYDRNTINKKDVLNLAEKNHWDGSIMKNLRSLNWSLNNGRRVDDPMEYIEKGKKQYENNSKIAEQKQDHELAFKGLLNALKQGAIQPVREDHSDIYQLLNKRRKRRKIIFKQEM